MMDARMWCRSARLLVSSAAVVALAPMFASTVQAAAVMVNGCDSFAVVSTAPLVLTCNQGSTVPGAPTGCVATINNSSSASLPSSGGSVTLNVSNCSASTNVTYSWMKNGGANNNFSTSFQEMLPANTATSAVQTSYQVSACAGTACTTVPSSALVATVAGTGGGSTGGNGPFTCTGFDKTLNYNWDWSGSNPTTFDTYNTGGIGANGAIVIAVTVPAGPTGVTGKISTIEYPGSSPILRRTVSLSTSACDFGTVRPYFSSAIDTSLTFSIGSISGFGGGTSYAAVSPGKYYINIANRDSSGIPTCVPSLASYPRCDIRVTLSKPTGY
jgi:hypothetical protein